MRDSYSAATRLGCVACTCGALWTLPSFHAHQRAAARDRRDAVAFDRDFAAKGLAPAAVENP